ncbi:MAG TPA: AbrB/MazE/SpoVT family DNA-binding domain-containing protein [Sulfurimonas sp.]|nr:AbrB/MazE/SpoVT family DNA-binding domain-containing protein [Sulfurimonas sp.]
MTATISKWGNSQGLRLPKDIIEALHIGIGDKLNIFIKDNKVILEPMQKEREKIDLKDLINQIPKDYQAHEEITTFLGKEEW